MYLYFIDKNETHHYYHKLQQRPRPKKNHGKRA